MNQGHQDQRIAHLLGLPIIGTRKREIRFRLDFGEAKINVGLTVLGDAGGLFLIEQVMLSLRGRPMYTKQEISKQKQAFWTAFGRYMKPVLSADGEEVSWSNYKTGIKNVSFKMEVDSRAASIAIVLSQSDVALRELYYGRLIELKGILNETLGENDWIWHPQIDDEYGRAVSTIGRQLTGVNIFRNEDWPAIISFLKPRIIALDTFWSMVKYGFEDLL